MNKFFCFKMEEPKAEKMNELFSNDNVNVGIRPDVDENKVVLNFCGCTFFIICRD